MSLGTSHVSLTWDYRGVGVITVHRPEMANALNLEMVETLWSMLEHAERRGAPAVAICSTHPRVFLAGLDLDFATKAPPEQLFAFFGSIGQLLERIRTSTLHSVALVTGAAIGAGADLAMACQTRVGGPHASFRFPGRAFGVRLGSRRLAQICGSAGGFAEEAFETQRTIGSVEAKNNGMLTHMIDELSMTPGTDYIAAAVGLALERPGVSAEATKGESQNGTDHVTDYIALGELLASLGRPEQLRRRVASYASDRMDRRHR